MVEERCPMPRRDACPAMAVHSGPSPTSVTFHFTGSSIVASALIKTSSPFCRTRRPTNSKFTPSRATVILFRAHADNIGAGGNDADRAGGSCVSRSAAKTVRVGDHRVGIRPQPAHSPTDSLMPAHETGRGEARHVAALERNRGRDAGTALQVPGNRCARQREESQRGVDLPLPRQPQRTAKRPAAMKASISGTEERSGRCRKAAIRRTVIPFVLIHMRQISLPLPSARKAPRPGVPLLALCDRWHCRRRRR